MQPTYQPPPIYSYGQPPQPLPPPAPPPEPPRRKWPFIAIPCVLIISLLVVRFTGQPKLGFLSFLGFGHSKKVAAIGTIPPLTNLQQDTMAARIKAIISAHPELRIGMAVRDLNSGKGYLYGESDPYIAASISKLLTASLFLHQVQSGDQSLNQIVNGASANYELKIMIEDSDNTAWQAFNTLLGHPELQQYASSIGLSAYNPDDNILTVGDTSTLLAKLYKKQLLNTANTNLLLSYMNKANETGYIAASIPPNVKIYHKAGWLVDRVHDAAIIDNGYRPYVLVIFTKAVNGNYNAAVGKQIFTQLTSATTQAFLSQR